MKGIRFYVELAGLPKRMTRKQLRERGDRGQITNVVAVFLGDEHLCPDFTQEALVATFEAAGSDVSLGSVSRQYLRGCRHIDEVTARKLHPQLFRRLDD